MAKKSVPHYFVYGEPSRSLGPGFLHVERVSDRKNLHRGKVEAHSHPNMSQLTCWTKGSGTYSIEDQSWSFSAPALCWLPSGVVHGFDVSAQADALVLSIADDMLPRSRPNAAAFTAIFPKSHDWKQLMLLVKMLAQELAAGAQGTLLPLSTAVLTFAARLLQHQAGEERAALAPRLKALIDGRFREPLKVEDYVDGLHSTYHLVDKAAHEAFGLSIKQLLLERRMLEAKRLLKFTIRSAEDIALELGFEDPAYFSRAFKKHAGLSPIAWRMRQTEKA